MSLFIVFLLASLALFFWFVGIRFIHQLPVGLPLRGFLWFTLAYGLLFAPFLFYLRTLGIQGTLLDIVAWSGYLLMGFYSILICGIVARELLSGAHHLMVKWGTLAPPTNPSRRGLLIQGLNFGLGAATIGITGTAFAKALAAPKVITVRHPLSGTHKGLSGLRIVQISDIHVSHTIRRPMVERLVSMINALSPDAVVLTGDLVDGSVPMLAHDVAPLRDINAPLGKFFITGNHEYYSGVIPWLEEMTRLGYHCLVNSHQPLSFNGTPLVMAGVTDYHAGRMMPSHKTDAAKALKGAPEDAYRILLAHQPLSFPDAIRQGCHLTLSGHTHGGQYFPYNLIIHLAQPWVAGLYEKEGARLYVNRGSAFWGPPLRMGAEAEITMHLFENA